MGPSTFFFVSVNSLDQMRQKTRSFLTVIIPFLSTLMSLVGVCTSSYLFHL